MNYLTMLDEEMERSEKFKQENFGLQVGDGYPELVREVAKSEKLPMKLIMALVIGNLSGKGICEQLKDTPEGQKPEWGSLILKNLFAFETPLALLYWGIQIGQKVERESAKAMASLE
jgi:hypothetical protein